MEGKDWLERVGAIEEPIIKQYNYHIVGLDSTIIELPKKKQLAKDFNLLIETNKNGFDVQVKIPIIELYEQIDRIVQRELSKFHKKPYDHNDDGSNDEPLKR